MRAILTYHSIDDSGSVISVAPETFRRQVAWLAGHGPRVVGIPELLRVPTGESAVALAFDDAFANFADVAWPALRDHGLAATLFVPTAHVGRTNEWGGLGDPGIPTLPLLDWDRLGRLAEAGVELGSHTCTHPRLTSLAPAAIRAELERSAAELELRTGRRPAGLAYPYGAHDSEVVASATGCYDYAATVELRPVGPGDDAYRLPRIDMYYFRQPGRLELWPTPWFRFYLNARAGARRCRALLQTVHPA